MDGKCSAHYVPGLASRCKRLLITLRERFTGQLRKLRVLGFPLAVQHSSWKIKSRRILSACGRMLHVIVGGMRPQAHRLDQLHNDIGITGVLVKLWGMGGGRRTRRSRVRPLYTRQTHWSELRGLFLKQGRFLTQGLPSVSPFPSCEFPPRRCLGFDEPKHSLLFLSLHPPLTHRRELP